MERASITSLSPLLLLLLSTTVSIVAGELRRVCYYTNWSQYRKGAGKFLPSDIDPQLCTHICFAFAKVTNYKLQPAEWNDKSTPWSKGLYEQVNDLKTRNPQLKTLLEQGAPVSKLNLGLPFYGRSFTLADPNKNGTNAPVTGKGTAGEFTGEAGFLAYYEICQMIQRGATIKRLSDEKVPYLVLGNQWVGYDDPESLYMKVEWAKQSNFSGIFVWAMDLDDFIGTCPGNESYILMKTVIRAAKGEPQIIPSTTETSTTKTSTIKPSTIKSSTIKTPSKKLTTATETTTTETTTAETTTGTTNDDTVGFCVGKPDKLYAVPQQCDFFYQCNAGNTYLMKCPPGTVFNPQISICDHAFNVPGC
uniref:Uncharacterized protein n=1 Tax=Octopus bimaculoides TaxID=37653 RepID=A0A0L8GIQ9_OCTBM